jgi:molecular chaperone DnaK (HSP70)
VDIINDAKAMRKLKTQVEKIKCVLSTASKAEINVDALHGEEDFSMMLTR